MTAPARAPGVRAVRTNRRKAALKLLPLLKSGKVQGGRYHRADSPNRCSIGHLFSDASAEKLERAKVYQLAGGLIEAGDLRVPAEDEAWFRDLQNKTDAMGRYSELDHAARVLLATLEEAAQ